MCLLTSITVSYNIRTNQCLKEAFTKWAWECFCLKFRVNSIKLSIMRFIMETKWTSSIVRRIINWSIRKSLSIRCSIRIMNWICRILGASNTPWTTNCRGLKLHNHPNLHSQLSILENSITSVWQKAGIGHWSATQLHWVQLQQWPLTQETFWKMKMKGKNSSI